MTRQRWTRPVLQSRAVAVVAFGGTAMLTGSVPRPEVLHAVLTDAGSCSGPDFCISSPSPGPVLYPGVTPSALPLTISNPLNVSLSVYQLQVSFTTPGGFPAGCPVTALSVDGNAASGSGTATVNLSPQLSVPADSDTTIFPATLAVTDNGQNQDACAGKSLTLSYSASVTTSGESCITILTAGPYATTITDTYNGNYTVASGATLYLDGGTITGNVTADATGQLAGTGGSIQGNVTSSGGAIGFGQGTTVAGNLQPTGGTAVCSDGTASSPVKISGNLLIQKLGSATTPVTVCETVVSGDFEYEQAGTPAVFGGSTSCGGDTISGNFIVENDTAAVTIGASGSSAYANTIEGNFIVENNTATVTIGTSGSGYGNTASGNISVEDNTGGGTLTNSSAGGNCLLQSDEPSIVGSGNAAKGSNSCDRTA